MYAYPELERDAILFISYFLYFQQEVFRQLFGLIQLRFEIKVSRDIALNLKGSKF